MFGCCVAGRLLQTNLQQVDETHAYFELTNASTINHICVFLLGTGKFLSLFFKPILIKSYNSMSYFSAFPWWIWSCCTFLLAGQGFPTVRNVSCYFLILLLVFIGLFRHRLSNEKPSAIFRLRGTFTSSNPNSTLQTAFSAPSLSGQNSFQQPSQDVTAILGLSIEPLPQITLQVQSLPSSLVKPGVDLTKDPTMLAERIVKHLFNYISGFTGGGGGGMMSPESMIPMGVIARWYENFLNKVKAGGVGFLDRDD